MCIRDSNITLMSYAGKLFLGFTVARCAVPDARELADDFLAAHEELKQRMETAARRAAVAKPSASRSRVRQPRTTATAK